MLDSVKRSLSMTALALAGLAACGGDDGPTPIDAGLRADLHIKQAITTVEVDTSVVFTVVVENLGPDAATEVGVRTLLPDGISVLSATCTAQGAAVCGGTSTAGGASWSGLTIPVATNDSNTTTLRVIATPTRLGPGTITADIEVPSNITDPDPSTDSNQATRAIERHVAQLSPQGGRVDWFRGVGTSSGAARPIAFDRPPQAAPTTTEVYLASPDAGMPACITCGLEIPRGQGYLGNPSWHPGGEYLVVQVENARSAHGLFNAPGWGIDADLWMVKADGTWAARIWTSTGTHHGALHAQFSPDGSLLVFGERVATASTGSAAVGLDGQDPYRGWSLRVARVDPTVLGVAKYNRVDAPFIVESVRVAPDEPSVLPAGDALGNGRYEPSAISNAGAIDYGFTAPPGPGHLNNQYLDAAHSCTLSAVATLAGATCDGVTTLAGADVETWDDLVQGRPGDLQRSFPSSRADTSWRAQASMSAATALRTELYLTPSPGPESAAVAITSMNTTREPSNRYIVGDHRWSTDGARLVFEVTPIAVTTNLPRVPEIWLLDVP